MVCTIKAVASVLVVELSLSNMMKRFKVYLCVRREDGEDGEDGEETKRGMVVLVPNIGQVPYPC
jgi:hypothetical protein